MVSSLAIIVGLLKDFEDARRTVAADSDPDGAGESDRRVFAINARG
jgi:hypothetical protein